MIACRATIVRIFACVLAAGALSACDKDPTAVPARIALPAVPVTAAKTHPSRPEGIAWFDGDVPGAFAAAAQQGKPVFVYFGAVWCPPCQELKATVFKRRDFLGKLSLFVPVYLDGDAPDAQRWADEFKVTAYPTALILRSSRAEIERVSGGMDLARYSAALDLGLSASRPIDDLMAAMTARTGSLASEDCERLAYNGWGLQEEWIDAEDYPGWLLRTAAALTEASQRCPPDKSAERARLMIFALTANLDAESAALEAGKSPSPKLARAIHRATVIVADESAAITAADCLLYLGSSFFKAAAKLDPGHAAELERRWFHLMDAMAADERYSVAERLYTIAGKLTAADALEPSHRAPAALADEAHRRVAAALATTTDAYTRTSLVNAALGVLDKLHDQDESYTVLNAALRSSTTPYYYMADLAELEEERGHKDAALDWFERAYRESQGQATRFQWGARYVRALLRLRPDDEAMIRSSVNQVLDELAGEGRIYGRSGHVLVKLGKSLHAWNDTDRHAAVIQAIRTHMKDICGRIPSADPARATCTQFQQAT